MRLDDSRYTFNPNEWFMTGMQADASETRRYVFEGADPHLKITGSNGMYLRGNVTLEFNLSGAGFPTDHPVSEIQRRRGDKGEPCACGERYRQLSARNIHSSARH